MKRIVDFFWRRFFIGKNLHDIRQRIRVVETQFDWLTRNSNRKMRRGWHRRLTNPRSPFYLGEPQQ